MRKNKLLKNIEYHLNQCGMSRTDLANKIGLSASTVHSWWQRGTENISISTLAKISRLFGISLDELVFGAKEETCNEISFEEREVLRIVRKYYVTRI